jgi:hypothetical protein
MLFGGKIWKGGEKDENAKENEEITKDKGEIEVEMVK